MTRAIIVLSACAGMLAACNRQPAPRSEGGTETQANVASVAFYVSPLVETATRARTLPSASWSQNDDHDSLFVVLHGQMGSGAVALSLDAFVRRVSLEDEGKGMVPLDTVGRRVPWKQLTLQLDSLPKMNRGRVLVALRPTLLDSLVPGVDRKRDEQVVSLMATVRLSSGEVVSKSVALLQSP
jgi:hypothetical protein